MTKEEKARRKELRLKAGDSKLAPLRSLPGREPKDPYPPYLMAFACFRCRRSFKQGPSASYRRCPRCGAWAINLGRNFKPPRAHDRKQWAKVQYLVDHGFVFQGVYRRVRHQQYWERQWSVRVTYPETLEEARVFVRRYARQARCIEPPPIDSAADR